MWAHEHTSLMPKEFPGVNMTPLRENLILGGYLFPVQYSWGESRGPASLISTSPLQTNLSLALVDTKWGAEPDTRLHRSSSPLRLGGIGICWWQTQALGRPPNGSSTKQKTFERPEGDLADVLRQMTHFSPEDRKLLPFYLLYILCNSFFFFFFVRKPNDYHLVKW